MGNIPPFNSAGGHTKKVITVNMQVSWDPDISVSVVVDVGVPVDEDLLDIVMNARILVIFLECDCEQALIKSLEESC